MARKKYKSKNEFRYNKVTHHTNYVFEDDGFEFTAVGITHSDTTFGKNNMPLRNNPQKGKSAPAYIRNGFIRQSHDSFKKPRKNFSFSSDDFVNVKKKIRNNKKNRKKNKKRK